KDVVSLEEGCHFATVSVDLSYRFVVVGTADGPCIGHRASRNAFQLTVLKLSPAIAHGRFNRQGRAARNDLGPCGHHAARVGRRQCFLYMVAKVAKQTSSALDCRAAFRMDGLPRQRGGGKTDLQAFSAPT